MTGRSGDHAARCDCPALSSEMAPSRHPLRKTCPDWLVVFTRALVP